ncbi:unnamed protein product [Callosobruchus maculatus]|uniref:Uncharacterized protein n=1 Tax=Callosobruchus maculatus TaxID=64391 RepID=A0A653DEP2_CALMS|nr:unnamed protein product [Callosobruchus maculatus]
MCEGVEILFRWFREFARIWDAGPIIRDYYIGLLRPLKHLPINQGNKTLNCH